MLSGKLMLIFGISLIWNYSAINSEFSDSSELNLRSYMDELERKNSISIIDDYVVLEKSANSLRHGDNKRSDSEDFLYKCAQFLSEREIRIKLPKTEARELITDARSKKIRKLILPLLLLLKLKAAIVLPIILSIIALVSFKGFGFGLAALAIAGTTALKNILEHASSNKVSYEVVSAPVGHWSRTDGVVEAPNVAAAAAANYQYNY